MLVLGLKDQTRNIRLLRRFLVIVEQLKYDFLDPRTLSVVVEAHQIDVPHAQERAGEDFISELPVAAFLKDVWSVTPT